MLKISLQNELYAKEFILFFTEVQPIFFNHGRKR